MTDNEIILNLYDIVLAEPTTKKYKKDLEELEKAKQDFIEHLENQNIDSLEELFELVHKLDDDLNKQVFFRGLSLGIKLSNFNLDNIEQ